jgi:ElaB/YqjD/DUF883 family membrane-anchored ribosome-binding protein
MGWVQQGGGTDVLRTVGNTVSSNPIPAAMIGIGVTWLLVNQARGGSSLRHAGNGNGSRQASDYRYRPYAYADQGRDLGYDRDRAGSRYTGESRGDRYYGDNRNEGPSLIERAKSAFDSVVRQGAETAEDFERRRYEAQGAILGVKQDVGEAASAYMERVKRMSHDMTERAGSWASAAAEEGGAMMEDLSRRAGDGMRYAKETGQRTVDFVQEQPFLLAATGLAVGAVLGMLLPSSRREHELLADAGRSVREQARSLVGDVSERAQDAASSAMGTVRDAAVQTLGEVRSSIEKTGEEAREATKGETGGQPNQGGQPGNREQDKPKSVAPGGSPAMGAGTSPSPSTTLPSSTDIGGGAGSNMGSGAPGNGSEIAANKLGGKQGGPGRPEHRPG